MVYTCKRKTLMSTGKVKPIHKQQKPRVTCRHRKNLSSCWHLVIRVRTYQLLKLRFGVYMHSVTWDTKEKTLKRKVTQMDTSPLADLTYGRYLFLLLIN